MARYTTCDKKLLARRQVVDSFALWRCICPGPGGELEDEIITRSDKLFRCDLAVLSEGGGVRDRCPLADLIEGAMDEVEVHRDSSGVVAS